MKISIFIILLSASVTAFSSGFLLNAQRKQIQNHKTIRRGHMEAKRGHVGHGRIRNTNFTKRFFKAFAQMMIE